MREATVKILITKLRNRPLEIKFHTCNRGTRTLAGGLHHYWSGFQTRKNASEVYEAHDVEFSRDPWE